MLEFLQRQRASHATSASLKVTSSKTRLSREALLASASARAGANGRHWCQFTSCWHVDLSNGHVANSTSPLQLANSMSLKLQSCSKSLPIVAAPFPRMTSVRRDFFPALCIHLSVGACSCCSVASSLAAATVVAVSCRLLVQLVGAGCWRWCFLLLLQLPHRTAPHWL
jgi:hypothetical protein